MVGRIAIHHHLQALLVGGFDDQNLIAELEALVGVIEVGEMQCELSSLSGGHIAQSNRLGTIVGIAVEADAYAGLLHLLSAIAERVLSGLEVLGLLLALVGVVALTSDEEEAIAPSTGRLVGAHAEVGATVTVAERVVELCPFLVVLVAFTL